MSTRIATAVAEKPNVMAQGDVLLRQNFRTHNNRTAKANDEVWSFIDSNADKVEGMHIEPLKNGQEAQLFIDSLTEEWFK